MEPAPLPAAVTGDHDLRTCSACGFTFLVGPPGPPHDRPDLPAGAASSRSRLARVRLRPVLAPLARHRVQPPGRSLEVGCGRGELVDLLHRAGWEAWACDPAEDARRLLPAVLGERFLPVDLLDADLPDQSFDLVVSNFSLEHVERPRETGERIARLLRPGGVALVRVPNFAAALRGRPGSRFQLRLPVHRSFFTPASMERFLREVGLQPLEIATPPSAQEGLSMACELLPGLDPERWLGGRPRPTDALRGIALAAGIIAAWPLSIPACRRGEGLVLLALARRPAP